MHKARWETDARWYEVHIAVDLFGAYTLIRHWGGKGSQRHGQLVEIAGSEADAIARLDTLDRQRQRRKPPYRRVV